MTSAALARDAFLPHRPAGMGVGMVLALFAHALLVVALAFSVSWRSSTPDSVEAELWAAVPQVAAPPPSPPPPVVVESKPPPPAPKPVPVQEVVPDAQIAIEKARREAEVKREAAKRDEAKREAAKREQARAEAELKKQEQDEKERVEKEAEALETQRQANLKRMLGQAGATAAGATPGTAAQSAGPSAGYAGRIKARIKPNIVLTEPVNGDPVATVEVRLAPDGTIVARKLLKSSGAKNWDEAVLRAIDKTEILPRDVDGRVPPVIEIDFKPRD